MNRYVRRGAKGIALLDESSGFPRLHYVFDVSDTGVRRNSRDPEVWLKWNSSTLGYCLDNTEISLVRNYPVHIISLCVVSSEVGCCTSGTIAEEYELKSVETQYRVEFAMWYAQERFKPQTLIDLATLTPSYRRWRTDTT